LRLAAARAVGQHSCLRCLPAATGRQPDIRALGYYTDKAGSVIDPALHQQNKDATAPLDRYAADVARMSDDYLRTGDRAAAQCTLAWLGAWADDGAMLGQMIRVNNNQSFYMRQWMLDAVAMAYLKVHDQADARQRARIDPWLQRLARANLAYWNNPKRRRNNHYYWGGWACWPPDWPPTTMPCGKPATPPSRRASMTSRTMAACRWRWRAGNAPCTTTTTHWRRW
jgi:poly(beta-D-mannuronate) lyase